MYAAELLETLDDLQHDLGKHLLLPVALLPVEASQADLQLAIGRGLVQLAAWQRFQSGVGAHCKDDPGYGQVEARVQIASAWAEVAVADRAVVYRDFAAVGQAIRAWRAQVAGE